MRLLSFYIKQILSVYFIFVLAFSSLNHALTIEEIDTQNERTSQAFIKNLQIIRVYIGSSPGFGHQQNSFTIMANLRQMGFKGKFEIVYNDSDKTYLQTGAPDASTAQKLSLLIKGFNPESIKEQTFGDQKITTIPSSLIRSTPEKWQKVELSITGGQDFDAITAEFMRSLVYLDLYPTGFPGVHRETISIATPHEGNKLVYLHESPGDSFTHYLTPTIIEENIEKLSKNLRGYSPATDYVLNMLKNNKNFDFMPIYGLKGYHHLGRDFAVKQVINLVGSVKLAIDENKELMRPNIALLILNKLSDTELNELKNQIEKYHSDIKLVDLTSDEIKKISMNKNANPEIVIYTTNGLPSELFNHLLATSRLPPIGGGANFHSLMKQLGRPYLSTTERFSISKNYRQDWVKEKISGGFPILNDFIQNEVTNINFAYGELAGGKSNSSMTSFISSCIRQERSILDLFNPNPLKKTNPNKLFAAIKRAVEVLENLQMIPPISTVQTSSMSPKSYPNDRASTSKTCSGIFNL